MVRQTLKEAVHRVKSMTCKRRGDLPDMMRFMYVLVDQSMVQAPMNPVDQHVREKEEGDDAHDEMNPATWKVSYVIVEFAVTSELQQEQRDRGNADPRQRLDRKHDLSIDLILKTKVPVI